MSDRWVCSQCSKVNDEDAYTCKKCGALRGIDALASAEVTASDESPFPPLDDALTTTPSTSRSPKAGWTRWLRFWWIPVAAVGIIISIGQAERDNEGQITSAGSMAAIDLQVGDCFDHEFDETGEEEVGTVRGLPCSEPHAYEVFAIHSFGPGGYPTEEEMDGVFVDQCLTAFDSFVGVVYEESELWVEMLFPTLEGWNEGDRSFTCFLFEPDIALTGSMRGANR